MANKQKLWVDFRHPSYATDKARRKYARDHYRGDVYDIVVSQAQIASNSEQVVAKTSIETDDGVRVYFTGKNVDTSQYLKRRTQGEAASAFYERATITRFPNHMSALIDSYVGGVVAVSDKASHTHGEPLGLPDDPKSVFYNFSRDVDGTGLSLDAYMLRVAQDLIVDHVHWQYADKVDEKSPSRIYRIEPDNVLNYREEDGAIVELLLLAPKLEQASLMEEAREVTYYFHYTLDGWVKYEEIEGEKKERTIKPVASGKWNYPFYTDKTKQKQRLPFSRSSLSIGRDVGYQMAVDHNMLYNILSDARWLFRVINHPRLAGDVDDTQWSKSIHAILEGMNAMQGKWSYIGPNPMNGTAAYETYESEVKQFYITNHQRMNGSNIERSATEIAFNEAAGRTSFLSILSSGMDGVQNESYFLLSQLEAPDKHDLWDSTQIRRSKDFRPVDTLHESTQQVNSFVAASNVVGAETAWLMAKEGMSEDVRKRLASVGNDMVVEEEL